MVLRLEAEEVTQYSDDLDADAKRDLLACLLHSVDEVLLFFRTVSSALGSAEMQKTVAVPAVTAFQGSCTQTLQGAKLGLLRRILVKRVKAYETLTFPLKHMCGADFGRAHQGCTGGSGEHCKEPA